MRETLLPHNSVDILGTCCAMCSVEHRHHSVPIGDLFFSLLISFHHSAFLLASSRFKVKQNLTSPAYDFQGLLAPQSGSHSLAFFSLPKEVQRETSPTSCISVPAPVYPMHQGGHLGHHRGTKEQRLESHNLQLCVLKVPSDCKKEMVTFSECAPFLPKSERAAFGASSYVPLLT